ncbi:SRPBCC domain-containing protein [Chryseobacterium wangxinyae]|uniref:SRPBCC family protein n=1 Tax=Chryseobacterium sp. CY350 TaxID=2997336 RepID=UPI00226F8F7F|nr:SRPBCC domain-containing protein [Chryseobacterium sp. CY350]MCY0976618.1 SRPBCC domain-containing protein [Chryseobacterium sp. CY350]WBZ96619.1 SRPBCC domain-containing protein [Chryseobacterium sp. CY350]
MKTPIVITKKIKAPIEKVWKALTDKNEIPSWYFNIADFEAVVGKSFDFYEPGEEKKYLHRIEILEIIENQKLKHTWFYPLFSDQKTIVTWELENDEGGTKVSLTHEGTENLKDLGEGFSEESFTKGWNEIVGQSLKLYMEN